MKCPKQRPNEGAMLPGTLKVATAGRKSLLKIPILPDHKAALMMDKMQRGAAVYVREYRALPSSEAIWPASKQQIAPHAVG